MRERTLRVEDKTEAEWSDLIVKWHKDVTAEETLEEFLGLSEVEYERLIRGEGLTKRGDSSCKMYHSGLRIK